jgi:hypothetical protein
LAGPGIPALLIYFANCGGRRVMNGGLSIFFTQESSNPFADLFDKKLTNTSSMQSNRK